MALTNSPLRFSRDDAARIAQLTPDAIDTLVANGALSVDDAATVAASQLESLFTQSLLRLYEAAARTQTSATIEAPAVVASPTESAPLVTRGVAVYEVPEPQEKPELRIAPRYVPKRQLNGSFRQTRLTVLQMSMTGLRIRHDESLRPGDEAKVTFSLMRPARTFAIRARVVWTSIAQRGDGPSFCISGLRITACHDQLAEAIHLLSEAHELEIEGSRTPKRASTQSEQPRAISRLSDEDVASVIRAFRKLSSDPVEASRWYARARFAIADNDVRTAAPSRARDREEVLGIWEYLERKIDIRSISGVVAWIRQTRSAAAV